MDGIERFSRKQKAMAEEIREQTRKMRNCRTGLDANPAQKDDLVSQLSWQTRIFEDRRKSTSTSATCLVIIEKRLFDLANAIQSDRAPTSPTK
jgi:hypothetical protein